MKSTAFHLNICSSFHAGFSFSFFPFLKKLNFALKNIASVNTVCKHLKNGANFVNFWEEAEIHIFIMEVKLLSQ